VADEREKNGGSVKIERNDQRAGKKAEKGGGEG